MGDSPVIGACNYADNRYGACACTGYGEMATRCGTARSVTLYLRTGLSLERAAREVGYVCQTARMTAPVVRPRLVVPLAPGQRPIRRGGR